MNLTELQTTVTDAAAAAADIAADPHFSQSPVAAALRSALEHASDLVAAHRAWIAANPPKVAGA